MQRFALSDEQALIRDSVAKFVKDDYAFNRRLEIIETPNGHDESLWRRFAGLGWLGLPFPERYGGQDGSPRDLAVVMEQFGRGLVVGPYFATVVLGGHAILFGGSEAQKTAILPRIADGTLKVTLAHDEPKSRYRLDAVATRAKPQGDFYLIEGMKVAAPYAALAGEIILSARTAGEVGDASGITLFRVKADAPGLSATHYRTHDGGTASNLQLDGVRVSPDDVIGPVGQGLPILERTADHAIAALSAEAVGCMWSICDLTTSYFKTREQFGQTIGKFQALQHRLVDLYVKCQLAQSMAGAAVDVLSRTDPAERAKGLSGAKVLIGRYGREIGEEGVQLHGGIGMTREYPVGHYFKRLTLINLSFGDTNFHLERYRQLLREAKP
jgi:alkylation response protein AidB-like acyl-CoA dehydrogenase